ncbi:MAG: IgGFc-binding protein [Deltaproteobacteria bacterium]|nr:IgGFc-binding protein [Deltaproteobacteria bacterium]
MRNVSFPLVVLLLAGACTDPPSNDHPDGTADGPVAWCRHEGDVFCLDDNIEQRCTFPEGSEFPAIVTRECIPLGLTCVSFPETLGCARCAPDTLACDGNDIVRCSDDGQEWSYVDTCDVARGDQCVNGRCVNGCENADRLHSNVGCEYWAVDLDNAVTQGLDATMQQYAVVVSNPSPLLATVQVWVNDAAPGDAPEERLVDWIELSTDDLFVFNLDPREVDGTPPGGANSGSHTAWTANAYKITSTAPIIAYQFNPLSNVGVFSNDASLLLPKSGLGADYTVMGWPQTIANTPENPDTDMRDDLRAFLTIVGTEADTNVAVTLSTDVMPLPDPPTGTGEWLAGERFTFTLGAYEILNLETGEFNADFTGTVIESDKPVAVYSGSEASDVPCFHDLSTRRCCADHLEEQLIPDASLGYTYVFARTPPRTPEVYAAGGVVSIVDEPEYFRILAVEDGTEVRTTPIDVAFSYDACNRREVDPTDPIALRAGEYTTREVWEDLVLHSNRPIEVGQFVASQEVTGIDTEWPGGDPAFILVPPVEQWRSSYVFLTPELYAFDYMIIAAHAGAFLEFDKAPLPRSCQMTELVDNVDTPATYNIYRCPLSEPVIVGPRDVEDGIQNDGVHEIRSTDPATGRPGLPFGLVVYGFDAYVSYGYPGGLNLIAVPE